MLQYFPAPKKSVPDHSVPTGLEQEPFSAVQTFLGERSENFRSGREERTFFLFQPTVIFP